MEKVRDYILGDVKIKQASKKTVEGGRDGNAKSNKNMTKKCRGL